MQKSKSSDVVFSTPVERELLNVLAALGFDTAQIVHSVLSDACDSAGALWWILRKKVFASGGLNLPDRDNQSRGSFNLGIFADTPVKKESEEVPGKEREKEREKGEDREEGRTDTTFAEVVDAKKKRREREKEKERDREREREKGKDKKNAPPAGLTVITGPGPDFTLVPPTPARDEMPVRLSSFSLARVLIPFVDWPCFTTWTNALPHLIAD